MTKDQTFYGGYRKRFVIDSRVRESTIQWWSLTKYREIEERDGRKCGGLWGIKEK